MNSEKTGSLKRNVSVVSLILFNTLIWYYLVQFLIDELLATASINVENSVIWTVHYGAIIIFCLIGGLLSKKMNRSVFLKAWILYGIVTSCLPLFFQVPMTPIVILLLAVLLGASGIGLPSVLAYFSEQTSTVGRGRTGGMIVLAIWISLPILIVAIQQLSFWLQITVIVLWRASCFPVLFFKLKEQISRKNISVSPVLSKRYVLYFIPWVLFCLINQTEMAVFGYFIDSRFTNISTLIEMLVGGVFGFVGGVLSDRFGRRWVIICGFIVLGLAYAILSIIPVFPSIWIWHFIIDGSAWGIFMTMFVLVIWGDLAQDGGERSYAVGVVPLFVSGFIWLFLTPILIELPRAGAFSIAALFLFVAVIPLLYASDTVPQKTLEHGRMKRYLRRAKELKEKYEQG